MSGDLIIRLGENGDVLSYATLERGKVRVGKAGEPKRSEVLAADTVIAVVPGQNVSVLEINLPVGRDSQLRRAAPFAVEDQIAEPVGNVHLAIGDQDTSGARHVGVVRHAQMARWMKTLQRLEVRADAMVCDARAYARAGEGSGLVEHAGGVSLFDRNRSVSVDRSLAAFAADNWFSEKADAAIWSDQSDLVSLARHRGWRVAPAPDLSDDLEALARGAMAEAAALNLLQGPYRQQLGWFDHLPFWRFAASIWLILGLCYAALLGTEAIIFDRQAASQRAQANQIAGELIPGARIVDARRQVGALLQVRSNTASDFVPMSGAVLAAFQEEPGVEIDGLRFDQASRAMLLNIRYTDYAALTALRERLEARDLRVSEGAARQAGGEMIGEVTLSWK